MGSDGSDGVRGGYRYACLHCGSHYFSDVTGVDNCLESSDGKHECVTIGESSVPSPEPPSYYQLVSGKFGENTTLVIGSASGVDKEECEAPAEKADVEALGWGAPRKRNT